MNTENNKDLFGSYNLSSLNLKNRIAIAPMTRISADYEGTPSDKMTRYYESFAKGGFGLIITEGTYIDDIYSQTYLYQPGIVFEEQIQGWKKITDAVHAYGAKTIMQIQHSGALSQGNRFTNKTLAPSSVQPIGNQLEFYHGKGAYKIPQEATEQDIEQVIESFAKAAGNAKRAGFDGVEIHGANGYFLDEFLTTYTNTRTDQYGGSAANRVSLLVKVINTVRKTVGNNFIVGIRISQGKVNDYVYKWEGEKEAEIIFEALKNTSLDYIHTTEFKAASPAFSAENYFNNHNASLATLAKKITGLPVLTNGSIDSLETAYELINEHDTDLVTIGKAALANHNFPLKIQKGEKLDDFNPESVLRPMADLKDFELV